MKLFLLLAIVALSGAEKRSDEYLSELFGHQSHDFVFRILKDLNEFYNEGKFHFSPLELRLALMNLVEMSSGPTQDELLRALNVVKSLDEERSKFSSYVEALKAKDRDNLVERQTKLYVASRHSVVPKTVALLKKLYGTTFQSGDFVLPDITLAGSLNFEGNWKYPVTSLVSDENFITTEAPLFFRQSEVFDSKIVRVPYVGGKYALYVLLPNSDNVSSILDNLTTENLHKELLNLDQETVKLTLPKFRVGDVVEMKSFLQNQGVTKVFSETEANLSRFIRANESVPLTSLSQSFRFAISEGYVSPRTEKEDDEVQQRSLLEVQEVLANRPFVYYVEDETNGELLIAGKYVF